ncbi:hypothetical protein [Planococcus sp. ISL-109]|uniref:hypothetical protein n=1 Tax=Planococcus sp. ISL-109 TaxID=2819166 RepID=UPI001BE6E4BF|nr:hypothetical protein [Planococcus sp. ISL-109]MBT2583151.1 hypothetical protein [Planococcus sp. ISL-109]
MELTTRRKVINDQTIERAYHVARKVYHLELEKNLAIEHLVDNAQMNKTSARDYIYVFSKMMEGSEYKRTINQKATKFYLDGIKRDYGNNQLTVALRAVEKHVAYYEALGRGSLTSIKNLIREYQ